MKNAKVLKAMLLSAAAVMLVVATVFATMAYLVSSAAVSNVFTVGNVKLHMYESRVNSKGEVQPEVGTNGMKPADTNSYHLQPGASYTKDPTVYVDGESDESYLFVRLRNDLKTIESDKVPTIVEQLYANGWLEIERAESNVDAVFLYVGKEHGDQLAQLIKDVDKTSYNSKADRTKAILDKADALSIRAKSVGKSSAVAKDATETKLDNGFQAIDVFEKFTLATAIKGLESFGGARVAIVAYAIQVNGISDAEDYTRTDYMAAWNHVKQELPFLN